MRCAKCVKCIVFLLILCTCIDFFLLFSASPAVLLPAQNYFLVANYFNSETSLAYSLPQLTRLIEHLSTGGNVYLSIFENGSEDSTPMMLNEFSRTLNVPHSVVTCNFSGSFIQESASTEHKDDLDLKRIIGRKRYLRMAALRNLAMRPLYASSVQFLNPELPTKVVFINDVYFTAEQVLDLIATNSGHYDIACGLDFYDLFYDILVTRDVHGDWFSGFFPYSRDKASRRAIMAGKPFRVFSCWNGMTVMRAEPFVERGVRFRGREYDGEKCECVQSECLLVCLDFHSLGYDQIYLNPAVRVTYEWKHFILYNMPILTPVLQWSQLLAAAFVFSTQPPAQPGIGCSMPPYWTGEKPAYMSLSQDSCTLPFDSDRPAMNFTLRESQREWEFYRSYETRLSEECLPK